MIGMIKLFSFFTIKQATIPKVGAIISMVDNMEGQTEKLAIFRLFYTQKGSIFYFASSKSSANKYRFFAFTIK